MCVVIMQNRLNIQIRVETGDDDAAGNDGHLVKPRAMGWRLANEAKTPACTNTM